MDSDGLEVSKSYSLAKCSGLLNLVNTIMILGADNMYTLGNMDSGLSLTDTREFFHS